LTEEQLQAMRAGRERAQQRRREEAQHRVSNFQAWLREDATARVQGRRSPMMPAIPSDNDYALVRGDAA